MAGIYIHIPFCRKACHYCNFHFSTRLDDMDTMVKCIMLEASERAQELSNQTIQTIYLGGGSPSLLSPRQIKELFASLETHFDLTCAEEITLEANPEDIHQESLKLWADLGINRLSIGIQSFFDEELELYNRVHNARQCHEAIHFCRQAGFNNLNIDLIYGSPISTMDSWAKKCIDLRGV